MSNAKKSIVNTESHTKRDNSYIARERGRESYSAVDTLFKKVAQPEDEWICTLFRAWRRPFYSMSFHTCLAGIEIGEKTSRACTSLCCLCVLGICYISLNRINIILKVVVVATGRRTRETGSRESNTRVNVIRRHHTQVYPPSCTECCARI
jgi:hypothetical protein